MAKKKKTTKPNGGKEGETIRGGDMGVGKESVREEEIRPAKTLTNEEGLQAAIAERGEMLEKVIGTIFPAIDSRECGRRAKAVGLTAAGVPWKKIATETGLRWVELSCLNHNARWVELWKAAVQAGEAERMQLRMDIAHSHAVEGTERPVFQGGKQVGKIREFDHRLLEFLLKADNPGKYREQSAQVSITNQVQQVVVMHRRRPPESVPINADVRADAPPKNVDS